MTAMPRICASASAGYGAGTTSPTATIGSATSDAPASTPTPAAKPRTSPSTSQQTIAALATAIASAPMITCDATAVPRASAPSTTRVRLRRGSSTNASPNAASTNATVRPCIVVGVILMRSVAKRRSAAMPPVTSSASVRPRR